MLMKGLAESEEMSGEQRVGVESQAVREKKSCEHRDENGEDIGTKTETTEGRDRNNKKPAGMIREENVGERTKPSPRREGLMGGARGPRVHGF
jgi:hypothetical protein